MLRDVAVRADYKLYLHQYVDFPFSHTIEFLEFVLSHVPFPHRQPNLTMPNFALVRFKLEYASVP
jgi:hypothetical protein